MIDGKVIPEITFYYREGDEAPEDGGCPIGGEFVPTTTEELFGGKRVIVFSLPGAYTPTCSTYQLPGFEEHYDEICERYNVDEIFVSSVNDGFVMNACADYLDIKNVKVIPDGNGEFADSLGMFVDMSSVGFGKRSRRFAAIIEDGIVVKGFVEPDPTAENPDPYGETAPENIIKYFETSKEKAAELA